MIALQRQILHGALESVTASVEALAEWSGRGGTPPQMSADLLRWGALVAARERPGWASPHEVVLTTPVARLRDFTPARARRARVVPTLVLPPQAGHDSCIVDYSAEQSQMLAIREAGLVRAYSLDWVGATPAIACSSIDDYLAAVQAAVDHIGEPVNLIGDCQGGWLAVVYAALRPEHVNTLTLAGAPIDFHAGEPVIHRWVQALSPAGSLAFYRALVAAHGGVLPGELLLGGFIAIKPENEVSRQLRLLARLDDEAHVARYRAFEDWYKHTQAIPGAFYLWIVEHLFQRNRLIRGDLEIGGEVVDLRRIAMPLNLLAGATDHITPPAQVYATANAVSTPPENVAKFLSSGGHLGLFMGHEALREHWPPLLAAVLRRSQIRTRASAQRPTGAAAPPADAR